MGWKQNRIDRKRQIWGVYVLFSDGKEAEMLYDRLSYDEADRAAASVNRTGSNVVLATVRRMPEPVPEPEPEIFEGEGWEQEVGEFHGTFEEETPLADWERELLAGPPLRKVHRVRQVLDNQFLVFTEDEEGWREYFIVSDAYIPMSGGVRGVDETMIFRADREGNVTDWGEIGVAWPAGSHEQALNNAGLTLEG